MEEERNVFSVIFDDERHERRRRRKHGGQRGGFIRPTESSSSLSFNTVDTSDVSIATSSSWHGFENNKTTTTLDWMGDVSHTSPNNPTTMRRFLSDDMEMNQRDALLYKYREASSRRIELADHDESRDEWPDSFDGSQDDEYLPIQNRPFQRRSFLSLSPNPILVASSPIFGRSAVTSSQSQAERLGSYRKMRTLAIAGHLSNNDHLLPPPSSQQDMYLSFASSTSSSHWTTMERSIPNSYGRRGHAGVDGGRTSDSRVDDLRREVKKILIDVYPEEEEKEEILVGLVHVNTKKDELQDNLAIVEEEENDEEAEEEEKEKEYKAGKECHQDDSSMLGDAGQNDTQEGEIFVVGPRKDKDHMRYPTSSRSTGVGGIPQGRDDSTAGGGSVADDECERVLGDLFCLLSTWKIC